MTPLTITKDEYSGKWVAWHLASDKIIDFKSEIVSIVFWKCTKAFYLIGVGEKQEEAVAELEKKITDFTKWLNKNGILLDFEGITSNLPEYRQAIYEYNMGLK